MTQALPVCALALALALVLGAAGNEVGVDQVCDGVATTCTAGLQCRPSCSSAIKTCKRRLAPGQTCFPTCGALCQHEDACTALNGAQLGKCCPSLTACKTTQCAFGRVAVAGCPTCTCAPDPCLHRGCQPGSQCVSWTRDQGMTYTAYCSVPPPGASTSPSTPRPTTTTSPLACNRISHMDAWLATQPRLNRYGDPLGTPAALPPNASSADRAQHLQMKFPSLPWCRTCSGADDACAAGSYCSVCATGGFCALLAPLGESCGLVTDSCSTRRCEAGLRCESTTGNVAVGRCCPVNDCANTCTFGFATAANGCRTCECLPNPCHTSNCAANQRCVADSSRPVGYTCTTNVGPTQNDLRIVSLCASWTVSQMRAGGQVGKFILGEVVKYTIVEQPSPGTLAVDLSLIAGQSTCPLSSNERSLAACNVYARLTAMYIARVRYTAGASPYSFDSPPVVDDSAAARTLVSAFLTRIRIYVADPLVHRVTSTPSGVTDGTTTPASLGDAASNEDGSSKLQSQLLTTLILLAGFTIAALIVVGAVLIQRSRTKRSQTAILENLRQDAHLFNRLDAMEASFDYGRPLYDSGGAGNSSRASRTSSGHSSNDAPTGVACHHPQALPQALFSDAYLGLDPGLSASHA